VPLVAVTDSKVGVFDTSTLIWLPLRDTVVLLPSMKSTVPPGAMFCGEASPLAPRFQPLLATWSKALSALPTLLKLPPATPYVGALPLATSAPPPRKAVVWVLVAFSCAPLTASVDVPPSAPCATLVSLVPPVWPPSVEAAPPSVTLPLAPLAPLASYCTTLPARLTTLVSSAASAPPTVVCAVAALTRPFASTPLIGALKPPIFPVACVIGPPLLPRVRRGRIFPAR
jgi:hypothetical protein